LWLGGVIFDGELVPSQSFSMWFHETKPIAALVPFTRRQIFLLLRRRPADLIHHLSLFVLAILRRQFFFVVSGLLLYSAVTFRRRG